MSRSNKIFMLRILGLQTSLVRLFRTQVMWSEGNSNQRELYFTLSLPNIIKEEGVPKLNPLMVAYTFCTHPRM